MNASQQNPDLRPQSACFCGAAWERKNSIVGCSVTWRHGTEKQSKTLTSHLEQAAHNFEPDCGTARTWGLIQLLADRTSLVRGANSSPISQAPMRTSPFLSRVKSFVIVERFCGGNAQPLLERLIRYAIAATDPVAQRHGDQRVFLPIISAAPAARNFFDLRRNGNGRVINTAGIRQAPAANAGCGPVVRTPCHARHHHIQHQNIRFERLVA